VVTTICGGLRAHAVAFARRRVAGAHPTADIDIRQTLRAQLVADARERRLEIAPDVVRQRLERRHVDVSQNHRTGAVDLFVIQRDASANILAAEKQHIPVNLEEKQFEYLSKAAMVLDKHLTVDPRSTEIRVVLRDATSGTLGSVTIPTKAIPSASL